MIFVDLSEGLGNQMFQYAFARKLQSIYGDNIMLDTVSYQRHKGIRHFSLNHFILNEHVMYEHGLRERLLDIYCKLYRKVIAGCFLNPYDNNQVKKLEGKGFYLFSDVFGYVNYEYNSKSYIKYVMGSWMNEAYTADIRNLLIHDFSLKNPLNPQNNKLLGEICNCNSVCVHIRLGDYLDPKWSYLNVCTHKYYNDSVNYIRDQIDTPIFFVFSNSSKDIQWIKENYKFLQGSRFVNLNNKDYEDLELMKHCKHFIIANSSYSWWAQFLCENLNKTVIAPNIWIKRNNCTRGYDLEGETLGIYQKYWKIIDV